MRVRWTTGGADCSGRFREQGRIYDDFSDRQIAELTARGWVAPVPDEPEPAKPGFFSRTPTPDDKE